MKHPPQLILLIYLISCVSSHGGCTTNAEYSSLISHQSIVKDPIEEECCAYLSYMEKGSSVETTKICMDSN